MKTKCYPFLPEFNLQVEMSLDYDKLTQTQDWYQS